MGGGTKDFRERAVMIIRGRNVSRFFSGWALDIRNKPYTYLYWFPLLINISFAMMWSIEMLRIPLQPLEAGDVLHSMRSLAWNSVPRNSLATWLARGSHQVSVLVTRS